MLAVSLVALMLALTTLLASVWAMDERSRRHRVLQQLRRVARQLHHLKTSGVRHPPQVDSHAPVRGLEEAGIYSTGEA